MATWLGALPALGAAVMLSIAPGLLIALALRLRGFVVLPVSLAGSYAASGLASLIGPVIGMAWSPALPFAVALPLALVLLAGWRWYRPASRWTLTQHARSWVVPLIALAIGLLATGLVTRQGLIGPDAFAQNYDGLFHLNAVQYILDTGSASPFDMKMTSDAVQLYPTLWHGTVANIVQLSGASIALATNALILTVNALVWPAAAISLSRSLFGTGANITLAAGVLAASFSAFPYLLAPWGSLFPNLLAIALLPVFLAAGISALGLGKGPRGAAHAFRSAVVAFGALGAVTLAHPNVFFTAGLMLAPAIIVAAVRFWRGRPSLAASAMAVTALVTGTAVFTFAWSRSGTSDNKAEFDRGGLLGSFVDATTNATFMNHHAWAVTLLVALGIVLAFLRRRNGWWLCSYLVTVGLYTVAAGLPNSPLREQITGIWYNDAWRIAGFLPVGALPFAALGLGTLLSLVQRGVLSLRIANRGRRRGALVLATAALCAFGLAGTQGVSIQQATEAARWVHDINNSQPAVDPDEAALLDQLDSLVPPDALIAGNPANGSSLAYALSHRAVLFPHFEGNSDPDAWVLAEHMKEGGAEVCAAANRLGVDFLLDFGSQFVPAPEYRVVKYPGLTDVAGSPILTEVAAVGDARLYALTGCN